MIIDKNVLRWIVIPDLDHPLCGASEEDAGDEGVPGDVVDRSVVRRIRFQEPAIETSFEYVISILWYIWIRHFNTFTFSRIQIHQWTSSLLGQGPKFIFRRLGI